ncbi:DUF397 domain-containing protein [Streptomyces sp. TRM43335]|uniref:DUF397 domain-containing protein n=1 Tax=Streptomyces taklimakanensis TaxID=2569853 RepID=A0A6G2BE55_9ACTN|nr:DUF397 domain-containing protein [Streptomyces taklimakanensis]
MGGQLQVLKPRDGAAVGYSEAHASRSQPPATPGTVHVRDSKDVQGPRLAFAPAVWVDFLSRTAGR